MTYEKVADELELATHLQEQLNMAGVAQSRKALEPESEPGVVVRECVRCGDDLPQVRIEYKRIRCTVCQVETERLAKLGRT